MNFAEGTGKTLLDEILGGRDIARQNPSIPRQPRDQGFDPLEKVVIDRIRSRSTGPPSGVIGRVALCCVLVGNVQIHHVHHRLLLWQLHNTSKAPRK